ncbi:MAG: YkoF family thiamine/hydroxymethylpyrimidine-binding protein [Halioglobus sp.]|nr:YkoF family thiamine/hydroxymethylpyrimidine-binding protein [Halioglobus sp.]
MTAELTLYPFNENYIPPIKAFIEFLNNTAGLHVETHATCTIISGEDQLVFDTLRDGLRWCRSEHGKVVLVSKLLPGHSLD